MTTKAGHVRVPMTQAQALGLLLWLREPVRIDPVIARFFATLRMRTPAALLPTVPRLWKDDPIARRMAESELVKALRYERTRVSLSRESAAYLASLEFAALLERHYSVENDLPAGRWPSSALVTFDVIAACAEALRGPGRKRRTRRQVDEAIALERRRLAGHDVRLGEKSNLRKLLKLDKFHRWSDEVFARGESILTTDLPPP